MTVRLPVPGSDNGAWGSLLNTFLAVSVNSDGTLAPSAVSAALSGSSVVTMATGSPALGKVSMALSPSTYGWARQPVDWINAVNEYGADPTGAADATTAINNALTAAVAGQVVYLPEGTYLVSAPIVIPAGVLLRGPYPVSPHSGNTATDLYGAVLKAAAGWTNGTISSSNNPGVVYVNGNATTINRPGIENLWVDLRIAPATTHGVSVWGGCTHATLRNFGVMGQATSATSSGTGNLLVIAPDTSSNQWTGGSIDSAVLQNAVGHGVWFHGTNTQFSNVHAAAYTASTGSLAGFYLDSAVNCRLTMCRSDQSGDAGFVIDSGPASGPSPGSSVTLAACGTQANQNYGLMVINSSTGGNTTARLPVTAIGCSFDSDGAQGGVNPTSGAGVYVQGVNTVSLIACNVTTGGLKGSSNNHLYPEYALVTATPGVPQRVYARGGVWNCNSGPVSDGASASPIVEVGAVVGSAWTNASTISAYTLNLPGGGGGMSNPMTTSQDIIVGGASGTPGRLGVGTNGQVLGITAGAVGWINNPAGFTSPMTTAGDIITQGSTGPIRLGIGANGNYLGVVGGALAYVTPPVATVINPSGDTSGVTDTKHIINAINGMTNGGVIQLGPGDFYITYVAGWSNSVTVGGYSGITGSAIVLPAQTATGTHGGAPISLQGSGAATVLHVVGNYIGIYYHRSTSYGAQFSQVADPSAGFIRDLVIDGQNTTGSSAIGLDVGDARGIHVQNVTCQNFDSSGQIGCQIVNRISWTEKCWFQIEFYNNTTACVMTTKLAPGGDHSNEYNDYNFTLFANQNQQGVIVDGTNQGGCNLWLKGNMCQTTATSGAPSNGSYANIPCAALAIINNAGITATDGYRWYAGNIWMKIEFNQTSQYPTGSVAPYGLYSDGQGHVQTCAGLITHSLTNSKLNGAAFQFYGHTGDPNLTPTSY